MSRRTGDDLNAYMEVLAKAQAQTDDAQVETPNAVAEAEKLTERELVAA